MKNILAVSFLVSMVGIANASDNSSNNGNSNGNNNGNNNGPTFNTTDGSTGSTSSTSTIGDTISNAAGGSVGNITSTSGSSTAAGGSVGDTTSSANSQSSNSNNNQTVNITNPSKITVRNVPNTTGIPLTSSNDTCMGSTSGSVAAPGIGVGFGTTWTDENCRMLKNSRELWNMGLKAAALALLCTDPRNKAAMESTGYQCPKIDR